MQLDTAPAAMIDLEDAAAVLGIPPHFARTYLEAHSEPPVAMYKGRPLWLSDTVHEILEHDSGEVQP